MKTRRKDRPGDDRPRRKPERRRDDTNRGDREWLYGRNAVRESLLANRRKHVRLVIADTVERDRRIDEVERLAKQAGLRVDAAPRDLFERFAGPGHQGVMLETSPYPYETSLDLPSLSKAKAVILALDGIEDPRNAGSLIRTAEATGVSAIVIPSNRAVGITPAVVNASSGAVEHLKVVRETNLVRMLGKAREAGLWVLGLAAGEHSQPLFESDATPPVVLVVGSEGKGLRRLTQEQCDLLVSLPMVGKVESLNAAVAGSVALYEIFRDASE